MINSQKKYFTAEDAWLFLVLSLVAIGSVFTFQKLPPVFITAVPLAVICVWLFIRYPLLIPYLLLAFSPLYFDSADGITILDLIYFSISGIFILFYFLPWVLSLKLELETNTDLLFFTLTLLIGYGVIIGLIHQSPVFKVFADGAYFLPVVLYFAFREVAKNEKGRKALFYTFILIILFVAIRNLINYREILLDAYLPWQQERARVATNEVIILVASVFFFVKAITTEQFKNKAIFTGLFLVSLFNLIITQSRGYWLAFLFAVFVLFLISDQSIKKRLLIFFFGLTICSAIIVAIFFYDEFKLVINALAERFESMGTGKLDVSLKERLWESQTILSKLMKNPITGYGFGTSYSREVIILNYFEQRTFIHNGYLLVWYKMGLVGLISFLAVSATLLFQSFKIYKHHASENIRLIALTAFSVLCGMLVVNNTSPQFYHFDCLLVISLIGVFVNYYYSTLAENNDHE